MSDKYCVLQDDLKDCGVCALLSVIKYYDGDVSKEYLRELTKTTKSGVNAINLLRCAREMGFESYGVKGSLKDVKKEYLPIIAHVTIDKKFNHFVVIYKIDTKKNEVLIMDPSKGYQKMSFSSFMNISTGYYLVLNPKQLIPKIVDNNNFFDSIKMVFFKYKIVLSIILFISFIYTFLNIMGSYNFKLLFDEVNTIKDNSLLIIFLVLLLLIVFKIVVNLFRNLLINKIIFILDKLIVNKAFNHIINLPYLYYKNHTNGDLLTRINDLSNIKELIGNFFVSIFVDLTLAIIILIVMFKINIILTIITLVMLMLYALVAFISKKIISKDIRDSYEKISIMNNYLIETLASFETIKNLSLQKYISKNFNSKLVDANITKEKLLKKINNETFFKNLFLYVGNLIILYLGVKCLKNNSINISSLVTFITLSNYLVEPIKNILDLELIYQNTKESIRRIREIYRIPRENLLVNNKTYIKHLRGNIDINHVSYSYNGLEKVVNDVSLEIREGEKVLMYGSSGCGKSTLMEILIKYLDNNYEGSITIDGYDLKMIDTVTLRKNICYVSQNEYLYTDSVYENITMGRSIKYQDFLKLCDNLYINEIVKSSSLNYNYLIENNGENLSGGEKMRIIIARSLVSIKNIYIYDETFTSLDVMKEREILKYIFDKYKDKTFIIISHRQSNIDLFDKKMLLGGSCE